MEREPTKIISAYDYLYGETLLKINTIHRTLEDLAKQYRQSDPEAFRVSTLIMIMNQVKDILGKIDNDISKMMNESDELISSGRTDEEAIMRRAELKRQMNVLLDEQDKLKQSLGDDLHQADIELMSVPSDVKDRAEKMIKESRKKAEESINPRIGIN